jgi:hypothetical protein
MDSRRKTMRPFTYTKQTKIINNKKNIYERKVTEEEEKRCVKFFSVKQHPFIDFFKHSYWLKHYLLQPRGQSRLATWQQLWTAWETEFFNCRQVRCLESERLYYSLLMQRTKVRLFLTIYTLDVYVARGYFGKARGWKSDTEGAKSKSLILSQCMRNVDFHGLNIH